jgi:RNA polymerase sigma factor (sigma-70 family)
MDDELAVLLGQLPGHRNWSAIHRIVREPMWVAAAQGVRGTGVQDPATIEDAVQQAFIEFQKAVDVGEITNSLAFARRIAYRRGIDAGRARRREWRDEAPVESVPEQNLRALPHQPDAYDDAPEDVLLSDEELLARERRFWQAQKCMGRLTDRQRYVVRERVMEARTLQSVADDLGVSHTTVRNDVAEALKILAGCIKEHGESSPGEESDQA